MPVIDEGPELTNIRQITADQDLILKNWSHAGLTVMQP
jgi:hypothetical protein